MSDVAFGDRIPPHPKHPRIIRLGIVVAVCVLLVALVIALVLYRWGPGSEISTISVVVSALSAAILCAIVLEQLGSAREQLRLARDIAASELVLDLVGKYDTELRDYRTRLARHLLLHPHVWAPGCGGPLSEQEARLIHDSAIPLLAHFERVGMMLKRGLLDPYLLWTVYYVKASRYHALLRRYVATRRKISMGYYVEFDLLNTAVHQVQAERDSAPERRAPGSGDRREGVGNEAMGAAPSASDRSKLSTEDLRGFLQAELSVRIRSFDPTDLRIVLIAPDLGSRLIRYHRSGKFIGVAEILERGADGHEYLGYVVAEIRRNGPRKYGRILELVVDSKFRGVGVGRRLCDYVCHQMSQWAVPYCVRDVAPGDSDRDFFMSAGFSPEEPDDRARSQLLKWLIPPRSARFVRRLDSSSGRA